jgi:hypothetical protein
LLAVLPSSVLGADNGPALGIVIALAFSADGRMLAAADDHVVSFFLVPNGQKLPGSKAQTVRARILTVGFTADGRHVVIATDDGLLSVGTADGFMTQPIRFSADFAGIDPSGSRVAYTSGQKMSVVEIADGKMIASIDTGLSNPGPPVFSTDGNVVALGEQDATSDPTPRTVKRRPLLAVFDLPRGIRHYVHARSFAVAAACLTANGTQVAAVTYDHPAGATVNGFTNTTLNVWNVGSDGALLDAALPDDTSRFNVLFCVGQDRLVGTSGGTGGGDVMLADIPSGRISHAKALELDATFSAALSPDRKLIATGMLNGVQVREVPSRKLVASFR